jgi:phosphatidylinositol-3,4,5-trisphosphate 3-phosphatase/dual-specificity protein phosphatase PTEN
MTEIKIRFRELSNVKAGLLKAANFVIEKGSPKVKISAGSNQVWASLARYDDEFVSTLEKWEKYSRDENGKLGIRRPGSEYTNIQGEGEEEERLAAMFGDGKWDSYKMVRCFGRLGEIRAATGREQVQEDYMVIQCLLLPS